MKLNLIKRFRKKLTAGALALATIAGTYSAHEGDLPPFYVEKTGMSGGICAGLVTCFDKGSKFYGPAISLVNIDNGGEIYGGSLSLFTLSVGKEPGKLNGLEVSVLNVGHTDKVTLFGESKKKCREINGIQLGGVTEVYGGNLLQLGFFNRSKEANVVQIGGYNSARTEKNTKRGVLFNWGYQDRK